MAEFMPPTRRFEVELRYNKVRKSYDGRNNYFL